MCGKIHKKGQHPLLHRDDFSSPFSMLDVTESTKKKTRYREHLILIRLGAYLRACVMHVTNRAIFICEIDTEYTLYIHMF